MRIQGEQIKYGLIKQPVIHKVKRAVELTAQTMAQHKEKILGSMEQHGFDVLLIYADREHGGNYGYLTGFEPRFEESILVLHKDGRAYLMLGNESLRMAQYSRIKVQGIHVPCFSLPNQPMEEQRNWERKLKEAGVKKGMAVGISGWKLFIGEADDNQQMYDVPHFIVEAVKKYMDGSGSIRNAADLFIHPIYGARIIMNANEIAHYEYGAALASSCVWKVLDKIEAGKKETELADSLSAYGQPLTVQSICALGERFTNAAVAPRDSKVKPGDRFTVTMGLRGGLTCRVGYAVHCSQELPDGERDYIKQAATPYYMGLAAWYSSIGIGVKAESIYQIIEELLPKKKYGRDLNPGHYTASEEWLSSPMYEGSQAVLQSGMMLQADIIIRVPGYGGSNAEDGIALGDENIRRELSDTYKETWDRMTDRRRYMQEVLGIPLNSEVLPMSDLCGYLRPYLLEKNKAMYINNNTTGGINFM